MADRLELLHLRSHGGELLLEVLDSLLRHQRRIAVRAIEIGEVASDALVELALAGLELVRREVLVAVVHGFELATVDRDQRLLEQPDLPAQQHELAAGLADAGAIVAAEI